MDLRDRSPVLPPGTITKRKGEKYLFLDPDTPRWTVTNANGAMVLKLCDGTRTIGDICRIVSGKMGSDRAGEILRFLEDLVSADGFFSPSHPCPTRPQALSVVHLNLTERCNLHCVYCYATERRGPEERMGLAEWCRTIDAINGISNAVTLELTGGEPLLSPYVFDVAEYAKKKGNRVHLLTNGLLVDEATADRMASLFDLIRISLDGSTPAIHDYHRGEGTFERVSTAIEMLVRHQAPVVISMTVTQRNIRDVGNMATRFGSLLSYAPLFKAGRAKTVRALAVTGKAYYKALSSVDGVNPLSCLYTSLQGAKTGRITKCAIGDAEISISASGDVYPCHLLHLPQFLAGNVREKPLDAIYGNSEVLRSCRSLDVHAIEGCRKCEVRFICGGSCRARAFYEKNRIDVSDDFCVYEKLAYTNGLFDLHEL